MCPFCSTLEGGALVGKWILEGGALVKWSDNPSAGNVTGVVRFGHLHLHFFKDDWHYIVVI